MAPSAAVLATSAVGSLVWNFLHINIALIKKSKRKDKPIVWPAH